MLPQVSSEALYSATFVENYLDCVENLPDELQRLLSRMRELDVTYIAYLRDVEQQSEWLDEDEKNNRKFKALNRIQKALIAAQELGDEKLNVVQNLLDLVENKTRQLDLDFRNLDYGKDEPTNEPKEQQTPMNTPPSSIMLNSGERQSKRARRTRHDTFTGLDGPLHESTSSTEHVLRSTASSSTMSSTTAKKTTAGANKKKKRKRGTAQTTQREDSPPREEEQAIDPDEPTYCLCDQISYGEMIMCDNDLCPIEWFHFSCVSLSTKPKGKWFCPKCRGDRPNVMKPKAQFLRELERYNKEKEEKT